jgi:holo-[acyl-carrier protein] synthase
VSAIAGIGTDLVKMDRIDLAWRRHPERFPEKILGVDELRVFRARAARDRARGVRYLATRFAAKEAFSKAIGLGMRMPMWWTRMQTLNAPGGRPQIVLSAPLAQWYAERYGPAHVSLTDESEYGAAYVVVESLPTA